MGKFVYFTSAEKRQANEVDLPSFLLDRGEKLIMAGRDYRLASDHSITVRGPMWYDHAARKGGRAISFVQQFYDKTYPEAVTMLLGRDGQGIIPIVKKEPESREPKPFALPEAYLNMRRLYAYLTAHRRIDRDVVTEFVREKLLYEDTLHHNCVFVGVDETEKPGTPIFAAPTVRARCSASMWRAARRSIASTRMAQTVHSMSLKRPLTCCLISRSIRQAGWNTAMWPAAVRLFSRCWSGCGRIRS